MLHVHNTKLNKTGSEEMKRRIKMNTDSLHQNYSVVPKD